MLNESREWVPGTVHSFQYRAIRGSSNIFPTNTPASPTFIRVTEISTQMEVQIPSVDFGKKLRFARDIQEDDPNEHGEC